MSWKLCVSLVLLSAVSALGEDEEQKQRNELLKEALVNIMPEIRGILGLENLQFHWSWRHWLVFHQEVNLTCRWGSVYPLEQLGLSAPAQEQMAQGSRVLSAPLANPSLTFRFDNCVLIKGDARVTEPLWGELSENEFESEVKLMPNQNRCRATITKLSLKGQPQFSYNKDNSIVKTVDDNGYLEELSTAIRSQIGAKIAGELNRFVGKTYNLTRPC